MPPVQFPSLASARARVASMHGSVSRTLVWALTLACVVLLIPVLLIDEPRKPKGPVAKEDAWLEFVGLEFANIIFAEAPSFLIQLELIRPAPSNDDEEDSMLTPVEATEEPALLPLADPLRWLDGRASPFRSSAGPNHLQYKLDPDFGLENRSLRLNGMMIRFRVEF